MPIAPHTTPSRSPGLSFMVSPPLLKMSRQCCPAELNLVEPLVEGHHVGDMPKRRGPHIDNPTRPPRCGLLDDRRVVRQLSDEDVAAITWIRNPVMAHHAPFLQHQQQACRI